MNDFFEHLGSDLRELGNKAKQTFAKITGKSAGNNGSLITATVKTNYEINLVPQVKAEMIKAQKMRNIVLFICILVSSIAIGGVVILFGIKSGQDIAMASQDGRLKEMSQKLNGYNELNNLITIQGQLEGVDEIISHKTVVSRIFGALGVMLPQGADSVVLSELSVNLETNVVRMDGQADAHYDPLIDYRVLESFKKGVALTKYDYGNYVDAEGQTIPTYCIKETDAEGNAYRTGDSYYAWWDLTVDGCEASQRGGTTVEGAQFYYSSTAEVEKEVPEKKPITVCDENGENCVETPVENEGETVGEPQEDEAVPVRVKVWRTPQYTQWYEANRMSLDGQISGIEHFESQCYKYSGTTMTSTNSSESTVRWVSTNDCMLAPEGLEITESSNGRDGSDNLVLKFSGTTKLEEKFFAFTNQHMMAIGPLGQNVTDSYVQIGNMFAQEATECAPDDTECLNNSNNRGGN